MPTAALYVRVSTAEQAEGHSIDAQLDALRSHATAQSFAHAIEYVDAGFQGDTEERPALKRLLADARQGKFDTVFVYRYDRLFREVRLFLNLEHELRSVGVRLRSITEFIDDTHEGRLQLLIKGSFAEYEKSVIRERANLGRLRAAKEGKWMGGPPPYGYDLDPATSRLVTNPEESRWVRQFFEWLVTERLTLGALQKRINALSIPTKWENLGQHHRRPVNRTHWWMKRTVGRLLSRQLYTGAYHYRRRAKPRAVKPQHARLRPEEEWITIPVPPLIDAARFQLAQKQLRANSAFAPRRTSHPYLLRTKIECGSCGRVWIATRNNFGKPYYICSGRRASMTSRLCTQPSISARKLEPVIWREVVRLLRTPGAVLDHLHRKLAREGRFDDKKAALELVADQVAHAQQEDQRLIGAYKAGVIDLSTFEAERKETRDRLARLTEERDRLAAEVGSWAEAAQHAETVERLATSLVGTLPSLSYAARCVIIQQLVDRVVIRSDQIEIRLVIPAEPLAIPSAIGATAGDRSDAPIVLGDKPGVERLTKYVPRIGIFAPIDPTKVIRITLYADRPVPHPSGEKHRKRYGAVQRRSVDKPAPSLRTFPLWPSGRTVGRYGQTSRHQKTFYHGDARVRHPDGEGTRRSGGDRP